MMEYLDIAGLEPRASRIGLGTWAIGGWMWGGSDEQAAIRTIHSALDRGITLIDTAPVYGFGRSEEIVGRALAMGAKRKNVLIATKTGLGWSDRGPFREVWVQPAAGDAGTALGAALWIDARERPAGAGKYS